MSSSQQSAFRSSLLSRSAARSPPHPPLNTSLPHSDSFNTRQLVDNEGVAETSILGEKPDVGLQPFFTLIENVVTSEHHHPTVHYIFADDDPEAITEAACCALAQDESQHAENHYTDNQRGEDGKLVFPTVIPREHFLLLDIEISQAGHGYKVVKAQSLSSEWQILNTTIQNAPTIDRSAIESGEGLMLKIEGMGAVTGADSELAGKGKEKETLPQLVRRFEKGLMEIRNIVPTEEPRRLETES